jgi:hypothetical protein
MTATIAHSLTTRRVAYASSRRGDLQPTDLTAAGFDRDLHFMLIEISGTTLRFEAVLRNGEVVDAGRIEKKN